MTHGVRDMAAKLRKLEASESNFALFLNFAPLNYKKEQVMVAGGRGWGGGQVGGVTGQKHFLYSISQKRDQRRQSEIYSRMLSEHQRTESTRVGWLSIGWFYFVVVVVVVCGVCCCCLFCLFVCLFCLFPLLLLFHPDITALVDWA